MEKSFLLCPPDYYGAHFLFNPWMTYRDEVDRARAQVQWQALRDAVGRHASIELLKSNLSQSALVFTRDNALVFAPEKVLILRSFGPRGKGEPKLLANWFKQKKYQVTKLPEKMYLEGGNLLFLEEDTLVAGWKEGESLAGYRWLAEFLKKETGREIRIILVKLVNMKYLHLDMVLAPLGDKGFLLYPEGLNLGKNWDQASLWGGKTVLTITRDEAEHFGANAVVVENTVITGGLNDGTVASIEALGFQVERIDLSEFYKAGGGAHCLTLELYPPRMREFSGSKTLVE